MTVTSIQGEQTNRWDEACTAVRDYVLKHGKYPNRQARHPVTGISLHQWVYRQRRKYQQEGLSKTQIQALESLPDWEWAPKEKHWQEAYTAYKGYVLEHDQPPPRGMVIAGHNLCNWANFQRTAYHKNTINSTHKELLESLPGWVWHIYTDQWETSFTLVRRWMETYNKPPGGDIFYHNMNLRKWIDRQKYSYSVGKLSSDRVAKLAEIFDWAHLDDQG